MKKTKASFVGGVALVALSAWAAGNVTWKTVDNPTLTSPGGFPWNMTKDGQGHLYAGGNDNTVCVTRKSDVRGENWQTVDSYQLTPAQTGVYNAGATAKGKTVYIGCQVQDASNVGHWIVRKSPDEGKTWSTVMDWQVPPQYGYNEMRTVVMDDFNHVYVAGGYGDLVNYHISFWIVRGSDDGGKTWNTLDTFVGPAGIDAFASGMNVDRFGTVYVVGQVGEVAPQDPCGGSIDFQTLRKSTDHGKTWKTYDHYLAPGQCWDFPVMVHIDDRGNLYTPGSQGLLFNGGNSWKRSAYIRVSSDGGRHWQTIDDYQIPGNTDTEGYVVRTDSFGNIYESGHGLDASGVNNWFVRARTHAGWHDLDMYKGESGLGARSNEMIFGDTGNLFAAGYYNASPTTIGWAVRKADFSKSSTDGLSVFRTEIVSESPGANLPVVSANAAHAHRHGRRHL